MRSALKRMSTVLSSVRFAVILIAFIALMSAIAAGIPQSRSPEFYLSRFDGLGRVILSLGFHQFFRSWWFLLPIALFTLNLLLCTIKRIRRHRVGEPIAVYGPDVIHIGILLLIAAGLMTLGFREERRIVLAEGQTAQLPGDYWVTLTSFDTISYADGSPRNWQSELDVSRSGNPPETRFVGVNSPLRIGSVRLYQYSHGREVTVRVSGGNEEISLAVGDRFAISGDVFDVERIDTEAQILVVRNTGTGAAVQLGTGARIGDAQVLGLSSRPVSVLLGVRDLGLLPAIMALSLIILGLVITFGRKIMMQIREDS